MKKTLEQIYFELTDGKKIKVGSALERRFKNRALKIYERNHFEELRSHALKIAESLIILNIADDNQIKKIRYSQSMEQFKMGIIDIIDGIFVLIESLKINEMALDKEKLKEWEIKQVQKKITDKYQLFFQKYKVLKKLNSSLLIDTKKLNKELKTYRTPSKNISKEVDAYIELIKKEPDKEPSPESLAYFSKGKTFQLGRTRWYELVKSHNFIVGIIGALEIEEVKAWKIVENCNKKVKDIVNELKGNPEPKRALELEKSKKYYKNKSDKYQDLADIFKKFKEGFELKKEKSEELQNSRKPSYEKLIKKTAIENIIDRDISDRDFKILEKELKNVILEFFSNN